MPEENISTATPTSETFSPTETKTPPSPAPIDQTPKPSVRIEKIDEKTARKIDVSQSVTILNVDDLRKQKTELESELTVRQQMLDDINVVIDAFDAASPVKDASEVDEEAEQTL